jgi:hypothetical protein
MMFLTISVLLAASPPPPPKVASLPWTTTRIDRELADFYSEALARALRGHGLTVTTPREIATLLGAERQRALLGCGEGTECLIELSSAVGCDASLMVSVAKLDQTLTANLKIISARDGKVLVETKAESNTEKGFADELERAAGRLAEALVPKPEAGPLPPLPAVLVQTSTPPSPRAFAWVPLVLGGVLAVGGGVSVAGAYLEAGAIDARAMPTSAATLNDVKWGKVLQTGGWTLVGVGGAAVLAGALMLALLPNAPVTPVVSFSPQGGTIGFAWELR